MPYDISDFAVDVIQRSFQVPVLVDFWAEWCGPCKVLGPILERLAGSAHGSWVLAKVDTEQFQEEATAYRIQSIPSVKLFSEGNVIGEFTGAIPEYAVVEWLRKHLPDPRRKDVAEAEELLRKGDEPRARAILVGILEADPGNDRARVLLAKSELFVNPAGVAELLGNPENLAGDETAESVAVLARLLTLETTGEGLPAGNARAAYRAAIEFLRKRDFEQALQQWISVIRLERYYDEDGARKACIAMFKLLGEEHPVTQKYRREFSSALYI